VRKGDVISGQIRPPKEGERYFALLRVGEIGFAPARGLQEPGAVRQPDPAFTPTSASSLENGGENYSSRVIDLLSPIGHGQRG
jgi:transcription termination factor Rho